MRIKRSVGVLIKVIKHNKNKSVGRENNKILQYNHENVLALIN